MQRCTTKRYWTALTLCWAAVFTAPTLAASGIEAKRYAVIVGNNHSVESSVEDLRFADDDAVLFTRMLAPFVEYSALLTVLDDASQRRYSGLASSTTPPTIAALRAALADSFHRIEEDRAAGVEQIELLFVFVGHGGVDTEGKGYVHLQDGRYSRADLFHDLIAASPADLTHIIIDACNAYSLVAGRGESDSDAASMDVALRHFLAGHDLQDFPSVGVLVATTDQRETHEWSRIQAGVFSHQLRSALSGAADINLDGKIEYSEIAAFVDAANAGLQRSGKRLSTFAWPPARDRRAALLDLSSGRGLRRVVIGKAVRGRLYVERASEERWAELNASGRDPVALHLPADSAFFLRDGEREVHIPAGTEPFWVEQAPHTAYTLTSRGVVDEVFERQLFAVAYDASYYQGFVSGRSHLVEVDLAQRIRLSAPSSSRLRASVGYVLGFAPPTPGQLEHAVSLRGDFELGRGFGLGLELQGAHSWLANGNGLSRAGLLPFVRYRAAPTDWAGVEGAVGVGYGVMGLSGTHGGWDLAVIEGRVRLGADLKVWGPLWLQLYGAYGAYIVTVDRAETVQTAPQLGLGLTALL